MAKPRRIPRQSGGIREQRRHHRIQILATLHGISLKLERLQISADARAACRDVTGWLAAVLADERSDRVRQRRSS